MTTRMSRRGLMAGVAGATAASLVAPGHLLAQDAPPAPTLGFAPSYTRRVGDAEVTILLDGHFLLEQAWLNTIECSATIWVS